MTHCQVYVSLRSEVLEGWKPKSKGFDVEAEMNAIVGRKGFRIVEVPIDYRDRMGEKKLKLQRRLWNNETYCCGKLHFLTLFWVFLFNFFVWLARLYVTLFLDKF